MTEDLERTLAELGPGYREVVDRLKAAPCPWADDAGRGARAGAAVRGGRHRVRGAFARPAGYLAAASLLAVVGLCVVFGVSRRPAARPPAAAPVYTVRATTAENEYRLALIRDDAAVKEMIRTQNSDGSWKNDFLTRRNAEALKGCSRPDAQLAYRKAMRNLRSRGL